MSSSEAKLVEADGKVEVWEVFDPQHLDDLAWTAQTVEFAGGLDRLHKIFRHSDRIGLVKVGGEVVGGVGLHIERMEPVFWFAAAEGADKHMLAIVRFFIRMKQRYPHFTFVVQNEKLMEVVERWASLQAEG